MNPRGVRIPAEYIRSRINLAADEIVYGRRAGWLGSADVVTLALDAYNRGDSRLEPIALLLSDRYDSIDDMLEDYALSQSTSELQRVWLFLELNWALDSPDSFGVDGDKFDFVCEWFGYPESIRSLMTFAPAAPGEEVGVAALDRRRRAFLDAEGRELRAAKDRR